MQLFDLCSLDETHRKAIFLSGLRPDIRLYVQPQTPRNLDTAIRLANECERIVGVPSNGDRFTKEDTNKLVQATVDELTKRPSNTLQRSSQEEYPPPYFNRVLDRLEALESKVHSPNSQDSVNQQVLARLDALQDQSTQPPTAKPWTKRKFAPQISKKCENCGDTRHSTETCRRSLYCTHCERPGHTKSECRWAKKGLPCPVCTKCGMKGHEAQNCRRQASN